VTVTANVSLNFTAADAQAAGDIINALTLPAGAMVSATISEIIASGQVDEGGAIVPFPDPAPPPEAIE